MVKGLRAPGRKKSTGVAYRFGVLVAWLIPPRTDAPPLARVRSPRPKMVSVAKISLIPALRERLSDVGVKGVRTGPFFF